MKTCKARNGTSVNLAPERRGVKCERPAGASGFCSWHEPTRIEAHRSFTAARHAKRRALREEAALAMENEAIQCDIKKFRTHAMFFRWAAEALRQWRGPAKLPDGVAVR